MSAEKSWRCREPALLSYMYVVDGTRNPSPISETHSKPAGFRKNAKTMWTPGFRYIAAFKGDTNLPSDAVAILGASPTYTLHAMYSVKMP